MELPIDERPDMAVFTAPHAARIVSKCGSMCAIFEAGETLNIRKELFTPAMEAGLVPAGELTTLKEPEKAERKSHEEIVEEGLISACKTLIGTGLSKDFTMQGTPRAASVKKLVDFSFTTKQVEHAFSEAMHEVEQDGNSSQEHSEPSSVAAE